MVIIICPKFSIFFQKTGKCVTLHKKSVGKCLIVGIVTVFGEFYNSNKRKKTKGRTCCVPSIFTFLISYFFLVFAFLPLLVGSWDFWSVAPELPFTLVLPLLVFSLAFSLF